MIPATILKVALFAYMAACANYFHLDPYRFQALCIVESRQAGDEFGIRVGKFGADPVYGPGGIAACFQGEIEVKNPWSNIYYAAKAAARYKNWERSLRAYNAKFTWGYYREIEKVAKILRAQPEAG